MTRDTIVVRFAREGSRDGVELSKDRDYQVSVDDGAWESIRSPWDQAELDQLLGILRNDSPDDRPEIGWVADVGRQLGAAVAGAPTLASRLHAARGNPMVVFWQLDYPELARLPWELACWWTAPFQHVLLERDVTFVRTVPLYQPRAPVMWPTGANHALRLLFVWGETPGGTVPHDDHLVELERICAENDVEFVAAEVRRVSDVTALVAVQRFDFVHVLAHGTQMNSGGWGLRLADEDVSGEQLARALESGETAPAMVTLAACDSANESADSFGSVAYQLHAHGIPMVLGSQFRLRKRVSTTSSARVYDAVLGGENPLAVLGDLRRQLSPENTESWSNEVLYMNYTLRTLDRGAETGRQQAALRKARAIARSVDEGAVDVDPQESIAALEVQIDALAHLSDSAFDLPETHGLLGSMTRRVAYLRSDPPDSEDLRSARDHYLSGLRADANSLYCGVNAVHLSLVLGDSRLVERLVPVVEFLAETQLGGGDYWAWASAGEVSVYGGDVDAATERYREFIRREGEAVADPNIGREEINAAIRQLRQFVAALDAAETDDTSHDSRVVAAALASLAVLESAASKLR